MSFFFFQAEDGIRDSSVTGVQTCALPIFVIFRENTEGVYLGRGRIGDGEYVAEEVNTAQGVERIIRAAFAWAQAHGKIRVTMSDKANAVPAHRVWQETFRRVRAEVAGIEAEPRHMDALALELVREPQRF